MKNKFDLDIGNFLAYIANKSILLWRYVFCNLSR